MFSAILTHNLNIICLEKGKLVQKRLDHVSDLSQVVFVSNFGGTKNLTTLDRDQWFDFSCETMGRAIPNGNLTLHLAEANYYFIMNNGRYMRSNNVNVVDFITASPNLWEQFRLLDKTELTYLLHVARNRWANSSANKTIYLDTTKSTFKKVLFGDVEIDMDEFLDLSQKNDTPLELVFNLSWEVFRATLVKPAIIFVAFGRGNVFRQIELSLQSLVNPAEYNGNIFIITNISAEDINEIIPDQYKSKTHIIPMLATDQLDYVGARLSIFNSSILDNYQPIIYSDADIIFDSPIEEFLLEASQARYCSAQIEKFHFFKHSDHTGGFLYKKDTFEIEEVNGFNGGLLLVPNMKDHGIYLSSAYKSLCLYTAQNGRDSIPFYDQSILNYVLYKMKDFHPDPVSSRTQVGGEGHAPIRDMFELDPAQPKGFVHFWNSSTRHIDMEEYLQKVIDCKLHS